MFAVATDEPDGPADSVDAPAARESSFAAPLLLLRFLAEAEALVAPPPAATLELDRADAPTAAEAAVAAEAEESFSEFALDGECVSKSAQPAAGTVCEVTRAAKSEMNCRLAEWPRSLWRYPFKPKRPSQRIRHDWPFRRVSGKHQLAM